MVCVSLRKNTKWAASIAAIAVAGSSIAQDKPATDAKPAAATPAPPTSTPMIVPAEQPSPPPPPPSPPVDPKAKSETPNRMLLKAAPPPPMPRAYPNPEPLDAEMTVAPNASGDTLFLVGTILNNSFKKFKRIADANPKATRIALFSRGGNVMEASIIARYVANRGMDTVVDGVCISACTQIFAAGKQRIFGPNGHMGFHAVRRGITLFNPEPAGTVPKTGRMLYTLPFKAAGVDLALVEKAMKVPPSTVWYPSSTELTGYRFVTKSGGADELRYPESFGPSRKEIETKVLKKANWAKVNQLQPKLFSQSMQYAWINMVLAKKWSDEDSQFQRALAQRLNEDVGTVTDDALIDKVADLMAQRLKRLAEKDRTFCNSSAIAPFNPTKSTKTDDDEEEAALMLAVVQAPRKAYTMTEDEAAEITAEFFIKLAAAGKLEVNQNRYGPRSCETATALTQGIADLTAAETARLFRAFDSAARNEESLISTPDWRASYGSARETGSSSQIPAED